MRKDLASRAVALLVLGVIHIALAASGGYVAADWAGSC
jgi:hypothetical protein